MNRSALNTSRLGAGNTPTWTLLSGTGLLQVAGDLTVGLTKFMQATGRVVVDGACTASHIIMGRISALVDVAASLTVQKIRPLDAAGFGYAEIEADLAAGRVRTIAATAPVEMAATMTPKIIRCLSGTGVLVMDGYCVAVDIYTGPAPLERTSYMLGGDRTSYMTR